jgi:uncharacterized membrane protein
VADSTRRPAHDRPTSPYARDLRLSTPGAEPAILDVGTATQSEVIEVMGYYGCGMPAWMWIVNAFVTLLFWGGLATLIVYAVRAFARPRDRGESPDEILKHRLAAGQISQEEYERARRALHG